jgi:hypothetical protein
LSIKENLGGPSFQSAASDGHRHTPRGHNLNYTIWILYAESVLNAIFLERALTNRGAPLSINQANLSTPLSINQANLSAPFSKGRALSYPILSYQLMSQELRMNGGIAKPEPTCRN